MTASHQHITCQGVVELVTDYLEHALDVADTSRFEQHLNCCDGCVTYVEQMRVTVDTVGRVGRVGEEDLPAETRDRLLTAFREWVRADR
jgi:anti-sigma factor RsiW